MMFYGIKFSRNILFLKKNAIFAHIYFNKDYGDSSINIGRK